jgi:ankyrin repeat protein
MKRLLTIALLLASGALPAQTPLHLAVERGDHEQLLSLLAAGASVNASDALGTTPLHLAAWQGSLDSLRALLRHDADPDLRTRMGLSPLELALMQHDAGKVQALLQAGASASASRHSGETLLMLAAETGVLANVDALLASGATLDARDPHFGQTALMFAARAGHAEVVQQLLQAGADPDAATIIQAAPAFVAPNSVPGFGFGMGILRGGVPADRGRREPQPGGMTALLYAARHGHLDVARVLLQHGASIDQAEANGIWPLLMAISNDNPALAQFLIAQGAAVNGQDWYGRSPLWEAVNVRNLYVHNATFVNGIDREPYLPLIRTLLEQGAEVNARTKETPPFRHHLLEITGSLEWVDFTGQTPFLTAALAGDVTVLQMLLTYGADPHIPTFEGTTALMAAAGVNWVVAQTWTEAPAKLLEAVRLCHALGMDVNQTNSMGLSALHGAANRGSNDIIEYLVANGADLKHADNEGRTALDWAKGVFLATHPAEAKPATVDLLRGLLNLQEQGKELR